MAIEHPKRCEIAREYIDVALETLVEIATHGVSTTARAAAASGLRDRGFGHLLDNRLATLVQPDPAPTGGS